MSESKRSSGVDLSVDLGKVHLSNPVLTASGTCGYAFELGDFLDLAELGGFITKSITLEPRAGNPTQRTCETASGMLNSIGLANVGLEAFVREKVPLLERMPIPVLVNVAGAGERDYIEVAKQLSSIEVIQGLELNVSCPNVKQGGISFGTDPKVLFHLVDQVRKVISKPLWVKLTPNVTDITVTARAAIEAGADALTMVNTFCGMAIDIESQRPVLGNVMGGLSGPAIKPLALHLVHTVYQKVSRSAGIPIVGMGGIQTGTDAIEFLLAGASAVAVGTQMMIDPAGIVTIKRDIEQYMVRHQYQELSQLIGGLDIP